MSHDLGWAARYAFTEDLWQGRPRVVLDAELEAGLLDGSLFRVDADDAEPLHRLVDDLIPRELDETQAVWMAVRDERTAVALGRQRPGTTFVTVEQIADVLTRARWETALIDLDSVPLPSADLDGEDRVLEAGAVLGLRPVPGKTMIVWGAARGDTEEGRGVSYEELAELALEQLAAEGSTQRIYGLYRPAMAAVVDFGEALADEDEDEDDAEHPDRWSQSPRSAEADDEIPLVFDNTLGAQEPPLLTLIAVTSNDRLAEGLGLIELPTSAGADRVGMRAQLMSAQAHADRAEIERRALLERVDELHQESVALRSELTALRRASSTREPSMRTTASDTTFDAGVRDEALEASMAREQALKWKVSQLEHQLAGAIARPVDALEAEAAVLRAELVTLRGQAEQAANNAAPSRVRARAHGSALECGTERSESTRSGRPGGDRRRTAGVGIGQERGPGGGGDHRQALALEMEAMVGRLERGGIGALELRRHLAAMARRLRAVPR